VTTRTPLFDEAGWREEDTNFGKGKADYLSRAGWTTQITLNRLVKLVFARKAFCGNLDARPRGRGSKRLLICPPGSSESKPDALNDKTGHLHFRISRTSQNRRECPGPPGGNQVTGSGKSNIS
jgi:hypothetical protein